MTPDYFIEPCPGQGRKQMDYVESILDPPTHECLRAVDVRRGQRCLDLGAGGGSITWWLAERVGPTGTVVAVDVDTELLVEGAGVEVYQHDISAGLPRPGPYDLIHARLLLEHLPRRVEILRMLVDALRPGGWLVLGELGGRPLRPLSAPDRADALLFSRIQQLTVEVAEAAGGLDPQWAYDADSCMSDAGLVNIHGRSHSETMIGGGDGCLLLHNINIGLEPGLLRAGATTSELKRYRALMHDPGFRAWFYEYVCTRGQKRG